MRGLLGRGDVECNRLVTSTAMGNIRSVRDLDVYEAAMDAAMEILELTKEFPEEETYSMIDQMRRSSRSVCANLSEAWRRRRSVASFGQNWVTPRARRQSPAFGSSSRIGAST